MEQVEKFADTGGMMGRKGKANKQNHRSANKQCASWFLSKNPFHALQAHNQLEMPFLCFFWTKKSSFFQKNSLGEGRLEIGDGPQSPLAEKTQPRWPVVITGVKLCLLERKLSPARCE
jgi:hypothetical protein